MIRWRRLLAAAFLIAAPLSSQPPSTRASPGATEPGAELTVYLVTMGPGELVWERFGHNAIWIREVAPGGIDVAWNWGLFDFNSADFIPRLMTGRMRYSMAGMDPASMLDQYIAADRSVWLQELALTPAQRLALLEFVRWNEQPANSEYDYDYYLDNCSTRVRDVLDLVLGGQIRSVTADQPAGTTFRAETQRLTFDHFPTYAGIMLALGHPADEPISVWEDMFLPMRMRDALRDIRVQHPGGALVPLVAAERPYFIAQRAGEPSEPPGFDWRFLWIGVVGAALMLGLAEGARIGMRGARMGLAVLGSAWSLVAAVAGVLLVLVWTVTEHVFMHDNENLLLLNPLSLALIVAFPYLLFGRRSGRGAMWTADLVAALALVGLVVQAVPALDQVNGELVAIAVPLHLALAWTARRARPRRVFSGAGDGAPAAGV